MAAGRSEVLAEVLQRLEPVMQGLRDVTRETVILGRRQKDKIVYLSVFEGPEVIRYTARAGDTSATRP